MKLFVDDLRKCPEGWTQARTITEAIRIIASQLDKISEISLDHDIGCRLVSGQEHSSDETFEPVARYINAIFGSEQPAVRVHTGNIEAGYKMASILGISYEPYIYQPGDYEQ